MAEQEEQRTVEPDAARTPPPPPAPAAAAGGSRTGSAVALARLLHLECTRLLQLYKERETFLADHTPDDGRMVSPSQGGGSGGEEEEGEPSAEQQVQRVHAALRQCLGLLHCVILREDEEWGPPEGDYATTRKSVRARLEFLLHSTKALLETGDATLEVTPDHQCNEEIDGAGGAFGLKLWTFRVLLELIHWADHAAQTLHVLHREREGTEEI